MGRNHDHQHLARLQAFYATHRLIPSYARIGELCGIRSKAGVAKLVVRLRRAGFIEQGPGGRLLPTRKFFARPRVGSAPAGFPSPAEEMLNDALTIDDYLVEHPARTVLVEVQGDSMMGAGIHDGDYVIVEREDAAHPGQIVVAVVDGEFTIKHYDEDADGPLLRPANPHFPVLRPREELRIFGIVVGQFRKYRRP